METPSCVRAERIASLLAAIQESSLRAAAASRVRITSLQRMQPQKSHLVVSMDISNSSTKMASLLEAFSHICKHHLERSRKSRQRRKARRQSSRGWKVSQSCCFSTMRAADVNSRYYPFDSRK
ncbi:protein of unknown function [Burkholderia multivorans]